jgi:hypothetical protein
MAATKKGSTDKYCKILHRFEKPKAKTYCLFQESCDDEWFIYVRKLEIKTNKETDSQMIIAKDVPQWIDAMKRTGWEEKEITK